MLKNSSFVVKERLGTTKTRDWKEMLQNADNGPSVNEIMGDFVVFFVISPPNPQL